VGNVHREQVKPKPIMMYFGGLKVLVKCEIGGFPYRASSGHVLETNVFKYCGRIKELRRVSAYIKAFPTRNEISWKEILASAVIEMVSQFKEVVNLAPCSF
jgi:hypothetical protein